MRAIIEGIDRALRAAVFVSAAFILVVLLHEAYHRLEIRWVSPPSVAR